MKRKLLGLGPGVGLVASNMIGAGVFLSAGFMAQDLNPGQILLAWGVGALLALLGARAYAEVARLVPRSGGEYRYLSELLHPALGYLAGWASLLIGFAAPIAVDALAAGAFGHALGIPLDPGVIGALLVVALTALHVVGVESGRFTQNALAILKVALVGGFVLVGLCLGQNHWPTWQPPHPRVGAELWGSFANSLFYIGFAFSGWNSTIYAAEEFEDPARDVPRAMILGCFGVGVLYLLVNWVFVANLTPQSATAVFNYDTEQVTLGHVVLKNIVGDVGSTVMSGIIFLLLASAISAMTFIGPRVYAAMAEDGFLPTALRGEQGRPPTTSSILQAALALMLIYTHKLEEVLSDVGALLTFFAALTVGALFVSRWTRPELPRPRKTGLVAAGLYVISSVLMLYYGLQKASELLWWVGGVSLVALGAYALTRKRLAVVGAGNGQDPH